MQAWDNYQHGYSAGQSRNTWAQLTIIVTDVNDEAPEFVETLLSTIRPHLGGECPVVIAYNGDQARGEVVLGENYQVHPEDSLLLELQALLGQDRVRLEFSARTPQHA